MLSELVVVETVLVLLLEGKKDRPEYREVLLGVSSDGVAAVIMVCGTSSRS